MPRSGENKDEKKNKRKSKGEMENEILQSLLEGGRYENGKLNEKADEVKIYEKAIPIAKEDETIIKTQSMLNVVLIQGRALKTFKDSDKFLNMVKEPGVRKSTVYFKNNLIKKLDKYPKLKNLPLSLNTFKDYADIIKKICKKIGSTLNSSLHYF